MDRGLSGETIAASTVQHVMTKAPSRISEEGGCPETLVVLRYSPTLRPTAGEMMS